jgi:glutamate N-acetyltransferase/amino-acid N-acetyltransferase
MASTLPRSPLAPAEFPALPQIDGISLFVASAKIKYKDRDDVMLMLAEQGAVSAGMFTKSKTASAAVDASRAALASGTSRAIITNSGNANAFTGRKGAASVARYCAVLADRLALPEGQIMVASTGVIGEVLDAGLMINVFDSLLERQADWHQAAKAICTTDTFAKGATRQIEIDGTEITLNGIAKGSGMIAPDMATMLCYIGTDAAISQSCLQQLLSRAIDKSFHCITVDSDTSTSDSVYAIASQKAGNSLIDSPDTDSARNLEAALTELLTDLAIQVVKDGEGATKLIKISVSHAADDGDARAIALSVANSPLVKTAIAGEDANWGRIVMAVGKSGALINRDALAISIGGIIIARDGEAVEGYDEAPVTAHMTGQQIDIDIDIGQPGGTGHACIYSCDLTHGYISINADYRS